MIQIISVEASCVILNDIDSLHEAAHGPWIQPCRLGGKGDPYARGITPLTIEEILDSELLDPRLQVSFQYVFSFNGCIL